MLSKCGMIIANMLSKCCNIIDAMCSLNVAQYIANILSNYCQYIAQDLASLTIDSIYSIFFVCLHGAAKRGKKLRSASKGMADSGPNGRTGAALARLRGG